MVFFLHMMLHYVKKIKGPADKNGPKNVTCKRTFNKIDSENCNCLFT